MSKIRRVVIGVDFNDPAIDGEQWAASFVAPEAELVLVHVLEISEAPGFLRRRFEPTPQLIESARTGAEQRLRTLSKSFGERPLRLEIRVGDPAAQIADVARECGADLIVIGKHGVNVGRWGRLGTTAERLIRQAPAPVLLAFGTPTDRPRHVLVALDDGPDIARVVDWGTRVCASGDEEITVLHVLGTAVLDHMTSSAAARAKGDYRDDEQLRHELREEALRWLDQVLRVRGRGMSASSVVTFGDPPAEIIGVADRVDADVIVVGTRGAGGIRQVLLGSVAREVLRRATRPVLVVTAPEDALVDAVSDIAEDEGVLANR